MTDLIIGQIFGIIATALTFLSYQANTKRSVLFIQTAATAFTCVSYFFLGASTGAVLNIVCIMRNLTFYFQKERTRACYISASLFAAAMLFLGALSWQGAISLLLMLALAANTVFLSLGNAQILRKSILLTSLAVLIYNCFVFSVGGIANEALAIISSAIGILRYRRSASNKGE